MEATRCRPLQRIVVTSPASARVTCSLQDAYRVIVVHEEHHFVQARRLVESRHFPR